MTLFVRRWFKIIWIVLIWITNKSIFLWRRGRWRWRCSRNTQLEWSRSCFLWLVICEWRWTLNRIKENHENPSWPWLVFIALTQWHRGQQFRWARSSVKARIHFIIIAKCLINQQRCFRGIFERWREGVVELNFELKNRKI